MSQSSSSDETAAQASAAAVPSSGPRPVQIISTGSDPDAESTSFQLVEANLAEVLSKVPAGMKVSVLSVVGAFRSGKSFLLTFFLRYLKNGAPSDLTDKWMKSEGDSLDEGNMNEGAAKEDLKGFAWRGGEHRQTTGIWMWSEPFIWKSSAHAEPFAILLMDTQGMFDNKTTMDVTVQIFGLSTLVSSYQIYNVDKRIQEDNLQHLACFSEYGRMALDDGQAASKVVVPTSIAEGDAKTPSEGDDATSSEFHALTEKPFQRIEFLVRDWQNFGHDIEDEQSPEEQARIYGLLRDEMRHYFADVVTARSSSDLQGTRDQITKCFEKVSCFLLPHPGPFVTKKNFNGSIAKIDGFFRAMLSRYVHVIFDECIEPKRFNGREITAPELLTFFGVYTKMFGDSGGSKFPKAMTMLEATSEANNRNAYDLSIAAYRAAMDKIAGPDASFVKENELLATHRSAKDAAVSQFNSIANMGAQSTINAKRDVLIRDIESDRSRFFELNSYRNPFRNVEFIIIPLIVAVISFILAKIVDVSCSTDFCERAEDGLQNIYLFIFFGIIVMSWRQISGSVKYFRDIMPIAMNMAK